jgi:hypothetical protein
MTGMASHEELMSGQAITSGSVEPITRSVRSLVQRVAMWMKACGDYWEAAALYDELRKLSNAELSRRGLSRDALARHACRSHDPTFGG